MTCRAPADPRLQSVDPRSKLMLDGYRDAARDLSMEDAVRFSVRTSWRMP